MSSPYSSQPPVVFDISQIPNDFGQGRLKNLLVAFDNFDRDVLHGHPHLQFPVKCESFFSIAVVRGTLRLWVNLHEVEVHGGQIMGIMPGSIFEGQEISDDLCFCGILLDNEFVNQMHKNLGMHIELTRRYYNFFVHDIDESALKNYVQMYKSICQELNEEDYTYKKEVIQRFCEIWALKSISLHEASHNTPELNKPLNRKEQIFHDFLTLLEQHYIQERSISFYADRMCLTPKYLSTIIKEVSGKHGMQWIDEYVILEAKALLHHGNLSVKQVSDQLHFPSQSMFGRFFKKMTGYSPKQYKTL